VVVRVRLLASLLVALIGLRLGLLLDVISALQLFFLGFFLFWLFFLGFFLFWLFFLGFFCLHCLLLAFVRSLFARSLLVRLAPILCHTGVTTTDSLKVVTAIPRPTETVKRATATH
jgi:hypothetical protein